MDVGVIQIEQSRTACRPFLLWAVEYFRVFAGLTHSDIIFLVDWVSIYNKINTNKCYPHVLAP